MDGRINGWKAIGAHFGRDRTTVLRWAKDRGLPVHRIPGGKSGTVFAFRGELDQWLAVNRDTQTDPPTGASRPHAALQALDWAKDNRNLLVGGLAVLTASGAVPTIKWLFAPATQATTTAQLPGRSDLQALYLRGRDDWARRTAQSLESAIGNFTVVRDRDPGFAPARAALAEAYLLAREFGIRADADAFARAEREARAALALDPALASAHRSMGFIQYWWRNDAVAAGRSFRRALELGPGDAQTHFWYGNILADNGQSEAALRELNQARLIEPGSFAIRTDLAYAHWLAGNDDLAASQFDELLAERPGDAVLLGCLTDLALATGDHAAYVAAFARYARARGEPQRLALAGQLDTALKAGAAQAHTRIVDIAERNALAEERETLKLAAFAASSFGDRDAVLRLLHQAIDRHEQWGWAGYATRIANRWPGDAQMLGALARLKAPPVE